tara:strand:- start:207 stop:677 length:471 start_codon:yes stop_codon:yes gene_type:complete
MKKTAIFSIVFLLFLNGCGFKVINQNKLRNFDIAEITTQGDNRINYYIKNMLFFNSESSQKKLIKINLNTNKKKNVKEKNIKNEITKYQINISVNVTYYILGKSNSTNFTISENGDYRIGKMHSQTINNEKKLVKLLTDNISEKIVNELITRLNDI